jgi:hypothetical protein
MLRFEFESGTFPWFYAIIFVSCEESRLLVSWCVGDKCDMAGSDQDLGRSRRPGAEDRGWLGTGRVLGGRTVGRSDDIVCDLHRAHRDEERGFPSPVWSSVQSLLHGFFLRVYSLLATSRTVHPDSDSHVGLRVGLVCRPVFVLLLSFSTPETFFSRFALSTGHHARSTQEFFWHHPTLSLSTRTSSQIFVVVPVMARVSCSKF